MANTQKKQVVGKPFMSVQPATFATEGSPTGLELAEADDAAPAASEAVEPEEVELEVELEVEVEVDVAEDGHEEALERESVIELGDAELVALGQALASNPQLVEAIMSSPVVIARLRQEFGLAGIEERLAALETDDPQEPQHIPQTFKLVVSGGAGNNGQAQELRAPAKRQGTSPAQPKPAYAPSKREQLLTSIVRG